MNTKNESIGSPIENVVSALKDKPPATRWVIATALIAWFGLIFILGARGAFVGNAGSPPLGIFLGFALPLVTFFAAYSGWGAFRAFIHAADLRLIAAVQAWRWGGLGFLSLYAHGILPGLFAFPAGLGDMAVGATAPWIVLGLIRQPSFSTSRKFVAWNIMGILDLFLAVSLGTICSGFFPGLTGNITTSAMAQLPLVLVPAYFVPLFLMLHFTALLQARRLARSQHFASAKSV
jgi:hypothetical protein